MSEPAAEPLWKRAVHRFLNERKKKRASRQIRYKGGDGELLRFAFTDPLLSAGRLNPATLSIDALSQQIATLGLPVGLFWEAYESLEVIQHERAECSHLRYRLGDNSYDTYCYGTPSSRQSAALLIPGSGTNQSSAIVQGVPDNYHGPIFAELAERHDTLVLVKPNEDVMAIHNGAFKLHPDFYLNALLNRGESLSARYLVDAMAWLKWMKKEYHQTHLFGLSQGGTAALYVALQAEPTAVTVAAGFSSLNAKVLWSGQGQIVIPGLDMVYSMDRISDLIAGSSTHYCFALGEQDWGTFKMDVAQQSTASFFEGVSNVRVVHHPKGHCFPDFSNLEPRKK